MTRTLVLCLLGLILGALAGATLGVAAGILWAALSEVPGAGSHGALMLFTLMPLGAILGGIGGMLLPTLLTPDDGAFALEPPVRRPKT